MNNLPLKQFSEDKELRELIENTPVCIKVFDRNSKLVFINKGGRKEHRLDEGSDLNKWDWWATLKKEHQDKIREKFKQAIEKGEGSQVEYEHEVEGSLHEWCLGLITPVKDAEGGVKYVLLYSVDISEYKRLLLERQENEQKYQALADAAPLCIKWFDPAGNLISVNKHAKEEHHLEGQTDEQIKKWDYWTCIEKSCHNELKTKMKLALEGKEQTILLEHVPGTATGHYCFSNLVPVKDSTGKIKYVLFISRDVTKEKEAEGQKSKNLEELQKFKELTIGRELKMVELKKALEQANNRIKELEQKQSS